MKKVSVSFFNSTNIEDDLIDENDSLEDDSEPDVDGIVEEDVDNSLDTFEVDKLEDRLDEIMKEILVNRQDKTIYREGNTLVKQFSESYKKSLEGKDPEEIGWKYAVLQANYNIFCH